MPSQNSKKKGFDLRAKFDVDKANGLKDGRGNSVVAIVMEIPVARDCLRQILVLELLVVQRSYKHNFTDPRYVCEGL
jgi:hypothetical protein